MNAIDLKGRRTSWNASRPGGRRSYPVFAFKQLRTVYRWLGHGWSWSLLDGVTSALFDSGWAKTRAQAQRDAGNARRNLKDQRD